jgi:antitoxin VapB
MDAPWMIRRVKILRDDDGQFVCIPRDFELPGEDVVIRKEGDKLVIEPVPQKRPLRPLAEECPEIKDLLPKPVDF